MPLCSDDPFFLMEYDDSLWFYPVGLLFEMIIDGLIHVDFQELLSWVYTDFYSVVKGSVRIDWFYESLPLYYAQLIYFVDLCH